MSNKNEVFEYLIDQLRQQVTSNQCEDLAQEVQSLKNQLRDASAQIKELYEALDAELKYSRKFREEQSGCRREDTQKCKHDWEYCYPNGRRCTKCGVINL